MESPNKRKALFIDRDGTLITEPDDFVIDSLEKLEYLPGVFTYLGKIACQMDFDLILVTNQDGLDTEIFPEYKFKPAHDKMINTLKGEGISFIAEHIDPHFETDQSTTRKPGTGMLTAYMDGSYDLENSFVIGDRITDIELAKNLGAKGILIGEKARQKDFPAYLQETLVYAGNNWKGIYEFLRKTERKAVVSRKTNETAIYIELMLNGSGQAEIATGLHFFDHMLEQIVRHSGIDLSVKVQGDLHVDEHHTIEDTALALGTAFKNALGNKSGIERYGFTLPMDDCLAQVALDFGGRPWLVWDAQFVREKIGDCPTEMFMHFFKSFSDAAYANINIKAEGQNEHHKIESIFKAFAKAIKMAIHRNENNPLMPSTKGTL